MKARKMVVITMLILLSMIIAACGGKATGSEGSDYPKKPITIIVPYSAGGGADTGARILQPFLEEELGVAINIVNKPGGSGWTGWGELANAKADGYTLGFMSSPNFMTGYLDPQFNRKENLESFTFIANQVSDLAAIAINPNETRFSTIEELIEYAKSNRVTATTTGVGSDDHYAVLKLNDAFGTQFEPVHNPGTADSKTQVMGGHVDVLFANVGEVYTDHENGELKVVAVMAPERTDFLPDVPTLEEAGYEGVYSYSARGIAGPAGLPEEVVKKLTAAFEKAITNEEHIKKLADMGLQADPKFGDDYMKMLEEDEQSVKNLSDLMGW